MSILHDVMNRTSQQCSYEDDQNRTRRKRRQEVQPSSGNQAKRPKTRAYVAKERADEIERLKTYEVCNAAFVYYFLLI
jgi:hypothetical protein